MAIKRDIFDFLVIGTATVLSPVANSWLLDVARDRGLLAAGMPEWTVSLIAIVSVVLGAGLLVLVLREGQKHIRWLRRWSEPLARFQGWYLQPDVTIPERPCALAQILYDSDNDRFYYQGWAFDRNLNECAAWHANVLVWDSVNHQIKFFGDGEIWPQARARTDEQAGAERAWVFGFLQVEGNGASHRGVVYDSGSSGQRPREFRVRAEPISPASLRTLVRHGRDPQTRREREALIKALCAQGG